MKRKIKIAQWLESVQSVGCIIFLALMSLIVIIQVFSRYVFNFSFVWAEEMVRYLMIWMVMFGAALVQSKNEHIRIDFFPMLAGARIRRVMEILFRLATLTFLAITAYKGSKVCYFNRMFESSGLRISMFWPTLAIPLGAIAIGCYTISGLIRDICQLVSWTSTELQDFDRRQALEKYHPDSEDGSKPHRQER